MPFQCCAAQNSSNPCEQTCTQCDARLFPHNLNEPKVSACSQVLQAVTSNSFFIPETRRECVGTEYRTIIPGRMKSYILPENHRLNSMREERSMILAILLGVLSVVLFLCISNFVISPMPVTSAVHRSSNVEQKHSGIAPPHRFRFVTLIQGVIKAIVTVFMGRPSGRKVTEPATIAVMTSWVLNGFTRVIRPRTPH